MLRAVRIARTTDRTNITLLRDTLAKAGGDWTEVIFIPQADYDGKHGREFSEAVYEYVASAILRMMGYYVVRDYQPWRTGKTPDISAFKTPEIREMIEALRRRRLLKYGAASDELQMTSLLGKVEPSPLLDAPDAETIVVEVKRMTTRHSGFEQLGKTFHEAGDLYDTGYVCAPLLRTGGDPKFGVISLTWDGQIILQDASTKPARHSDHETQALRTEELEAVSAHFKLELLKNIGIVGAVKTVTQGEDITYQQFMERLAKLDPELVVESAEPS